MNASEEFADFCVRSINRHSQCDWGDLEQDDIEQNEIAYNHGERILSSYNLPKPINDETKIWIITEWDRKSTVVLFPGEY